MTRMMFGAALAAASGVILADPAAAEDRPPLALKAEQCLRSNVERVVAAEPNVASAADFLVTYACADEVATLVRYQRNIAYVRLLSAVAASSAPAAPPGSPPKPPPPPIDPKALVNPETGDLNLPPPAPGAPANPMAGLLPMLNGLSGQLIPTAAPPELRRLAGELVLAAREKRRAPRR